MNVIQVVAPLAEAASMTAIVFGGGITEEIVGG